MPLSFFILRTFYFSPQIHNAVRHVPQGTQDFKSLFISGSGCASLTSANSGCMNDRKIVIGQKNNSIHFRHGKLTASTIIPKILKIFLNPRLDIRSDILHLHPAGLTRPAPAESSQDRKVARVSGCSGAM